MAEVRIVRVIRGLGVSVVSGPVRADIAHALIERALEAWGHRFEFRIV